MLSKYGKSMHQLKIKLEKNLYLHNKVGKT